MDNVVTFVNGFIEKVQARDDISGRLELVHNSKDIKLEPIKGYFNIVDTTTPADYFAQQKLGKRKSKVLKGILNLGNKVHRIAQSWLKQHEDYFGSESILDGFFVGVSVRGKVDGRILTNILEIKSIKNIPEKAEDIILKYPQYVEQLAFYSAIDPLSPKENYLIFITRNYPYKIRCFKLNILDIEKIRNILKKRIYTMKQVFSGESDPSILGRCRYCDSEYCNAKENCPLISLNPLNCEIKDYVSISDDKEFTEKVIKLKEKYGDSFESYSAYNLLHPRIFCLRELIGSDEDEEINEGNTIAKAYFSNLVYEFMKENNLLTKDINSSNFHEFSLNRYSWFKDKNSITPEGKITPFITHVSNSSDFNRPHPYKIAEMGLYLMAHKITRGMIFQYYPLKDKIKVFELTFNFNGDYLNEIKKIIEGLKNPENFKNLPKCSFGCEKCGYKQKCLD